MMNITDDWWLSQVEAGNRKAPAVPQSGWKSHPIVFSSSRSFHRWVGTLNCY